MTEQLLTVSQIRHKATEATERAGMINTYACEHGHRTVVILAENGVTPFTITCPYCQKTSFSGMYKEPADPREVSWMFVRPETLTECRAWAQIDGCGGAEGLYEEHWQSGGLVLVPIPKSKDWFMRVMQVVMLSMTTRHAEHNQSTPQEMYDNIVQSITGFQQQIADEEHDLAYASAVEVIAHMARFVTYLRTCE